MQMLHDTSLCLIHDLEDLLLGPLVSRSDLSYAHRAHLVSNSDSFVNRLACYEGTAESTSEGITCTVGIYNLVI